MRYIYKLLKKLSFYSMVNRYICKIHITNFIKVLISFYLIIFFVNFIEGLDNSSDGSISILLSVKISALKSLDFINSISPSLVLFSSLLTVYLLSSNNEITIIRCSGYSIWHFAAPLVITSFIMGVFWITIFNTISIHAYKTAVNIEENIGVIDQPREVLSPKTGIWIKQENFDHAKGYIIIKSNMLYKDKIELVDNSIWFFNDEQRFYKKINSRQMFLEEKKWRVPTANVSAANVINQKYSNLEISTNLDYQTFSSKFLSNFEEARMFSMFSIPLVIGDLKELGLSSRKLLVQLNYLLSLPILFSIMTIFSLFFAISNARNDNVALKLSLGAAVGLAVYIFTNFIRALGVAGMLPIFISTWLAVIICFALSVIGVYKKEG